MQIVQRFQGEGLEKFERAVDTLSKETKVHRAHRLSINRIGGKAFTGVKRSLAKQVGLTQKKLIELGNLRPVKANFTNLEYVIKANGAQISLKEFNAKQFSFGTRAKPWGKSQKFAGAFIFAGTPGSGNMVNNGHVFTRLSSSSAPIKKLWGPSIPKELVKDESAEAFAEVSGQLPGEVAKTIRKITDGVIS